MMYVSFKKKHEFALFGHASSHDCPTITTICGDLVDTNHGKPGISAKKTGKLPANGSANYPTQSCIFAG